MEGKHDPAEARVESSAGGDVIGETRKRPRPKRDRGLDPSVQGHIGRRLKAIYDDVLRQPVPDRFTDLLTQLDGTKLDGKKDERS